ncbi:polysaccharide deacetylase family protein [Paenibacillus sp. CC-CFT747]|nr:polysaccharide deacetylase family protein [Paenibacillus sp. CC-CFT747]
MQHKYIGLGALVVALLLWGLGPVTGIDRYIETIRHPSSRPADPWKQLAAWKTAVQGEGLTEEEWKARIEKEAPAQRIAPINAKVDRIWKAIPGYNGREVDKERTLALARDLPKGSPLPFVYREIKPEVGLEDLGPQPIYKGNPNKPMISLMINVAWGDEYLVKMLDTLKKENVHATFFFDGTWLSKNLETARRIGEQGHELSNHAYTHKNMSQLSRAKAVEEITRTEKLLEQLGVHNTLFAPPSGDFDAETVKVAHEMKLRTVLWTLDTVDWKKPEPSAVVKRITSQLEPGSLILMHPTHASSEALSSIIQAAKSRGLVLGTVSELLSPDRIPELEPKEAPKK